MWKWLTKCLKFWNQHAIEMFQTSNWCGNSEYYSKDWKSNNQMLPKLLQLSGIGAIELLDSFQIKHVYSNPAVGQNLQDHLMTGVHFKSKNNQFINTIPTDTVERIYKVNI